MSIQGGFSRKCRKAAGRPCPYCGRSMTRRGRLAASKDHILAKSRGGALSDFYGFNELIVCSLCNNHKADMSLAAFCVTLAWHGDKRVVHVASVIAAIHRRVPSAVAALLTGVGEVVG